MGNRLYISLGSNISPAENLVSAVRELATVGKIDAVSSVWETKPVGVEDQDDYLNAVIRMDIEATLEELFVRFIPQIEEKLGRLRSEDKFAPRSIDLDILLFNNFVGEVHGHRLPSSDILERPFVGIPLAEISPDDIHPETGITFREIASNFQFNPDEMRLYEEIELGWAKEKDGNSGRYRL